MICSNLTQDVTHTNATGKKKQSKRYRKERNERTFFASMLRSQRCWLSAFWAKIVGSVLSFIKVKIVSTSPRNRLHNCILPQVTTKPLQPCYNRCFFLSFFELIHVEPPLKQLIWLQGICLKVLSSSWITSQYFHWILKHSKHSRTGQSSLFFQGQSYVWHGITRRGLCCIC